MPKDFLHATGNSNHWWWSSGSGNSTIVCYNIISSRSGESNIVARLSPAIPSLNHKYLLSMFKLTMHFHHIQ